MLNLSSLNRFLKVHLADCLPLLFSEGGKAASNEANEMGGEKTNNNYLYGSWKIGHNCESRFNLNGRARCQLTFSFCFVHNKQTYKISFLFKFYALFR